MKILYKKKFAKAYRKLSPKNQLKVDATIQKFHENVRDSALRNHSLKWSYLWFRSLDVTGDIRIIFRELSDGSYEVVEMVNIGTHSQLY